MLPARQGADGAGGVQAVHDRHLHVHQDQVVGGGAGLLDGFPAVGRQVDREMDATQQFQRDFPVDGVVFGQQQPGAGRAPP